MAFDRLRPLAPRAALLLLALPIFLLTLLPLVSSTSPSVANLYLLRAKWSTTTKKDTWLHVGYYGLCWTGGTSTTTVCTTTSGSTAQSIANALFDASDRGDDTLKGIQFGLDLQHSVFVAFMTAAGLAWAVSAFLTGMVVLAKGGDNVGRSWRVSAVASAGVAAVLMVASSWATSQSARAFEIIDRYTSGDEKYFGSGETLEALQWVAALLACVWVWAVERTVNGDRREQVYTYNSWR